MKKEIEKLDEILHRHWIIDGRISRIYEFIKDEAKGKRLAIIFDIDGTLADNKYREKILQENPNNWDKYYEGIENDFVSLPVWLLFQSIANDLKYDIIVVTARSEKYYDITSEWLINRGLVYKMLFMRSVDDKRPDFEVKKSILDLIQKEYKVLYAVEDKESVAEMYRKNGIFVFKV